MHRRVVGAVSFSDPDSNPITEGDLESFIHQGNCFICREPMVVNGVLNDQPVPCYSSREHRGTRVGYEHGAHYGCATEWTITINADRCAMCQLPFWNPGTFVPSSSLEVCIEQFIDTWNARINAFANRTIIDRLKRYMRDRVLSDMMAARDPRVTFRQTIDPMEVVDLIGNVIDEIYRSASDAKKRRLMTLQLEAWVVLMNGLRTRMPRLVGLGQDADWRGVNHVIIRRIWFLYTHINEMVVWMFAGPWFHWDWSTNSGELDNLYNKFVYGNARIPISRINENPPVVESYRTRRLNSNECRLLMRTYLGSAMAWAGDQFRDDWTEEEMNNWTPEQIASFVEQRNWQEDMDLELNLNNWHDVQTMLYRARRESV